MLTLIMFDGPFDEPAAVDVDRLAWIDRKIVLGALQDVTVRCFSNLPLLRVQRRVAEGLIDPAMVRVEFADGSPEIHADGELEWAPNDIGMAAYREVVAMRRAQR